MKLFHPVSWAALAAAAAMASPSLAMRIAPDVPPAALTAPVQFEVYLPLRNKDELEKLLARQHTPGSPDYQKWLTPGEFATRFGPTPQSMARVQAAARAAGLRVTDVHERSFHVAGAAGQVNKMFNVPLMAVPRQDGSIRPVTDRKLIMPTVFQEERVNIVGLHNMPPHHLMSRRVATDVLASANPNNRTAPPDQGYYFDDLKQAYDYPSVTTKVTSAKTGGVAEPLDGYGVNVAIVIYDKIYTQDVANMFAEEKWSTYTTIPVPTVTSIGIAGGSTSASGGGTDEASLDVEMVTGGAPGAKVSMLDIIDLSDTYIMAAYNYVNTQNTFDIVNSSFGGCELSYTAAYNGGTSYTYYLDDYHEIFEQGNSQGITFVASSGDEGGLECPAASTLPTKSVPYGFSGSFVPSIGSPADDPNVTAVGGTNLVTAYASGSLNSAYVGENADGDPESPMSNYYGSTACGGKTGITCPTISGGYWGATGGISAYFAQPGYQSAAAGVNTGSTMRTNPDIGMQVGGCPGGTISPCPNPASEFGPYGVDRSYVEVFINSKLKGTTYSGVDGLIGTSVASPEFCGALALYVEATGHRQGNVNNFLYHAGSAQTMAGGMTAPPAQQYFHRNIAGWNGVDRDTVPTAADNYTYMTGNGTPDVRTLFGFTADAATGIPQSTTNP